MNQSIAELIAGSRQHRPWGPEDIITGEIAREALLEHPRFSRAGRAHLAIYRFSPVHGQELADNIVRALKGKDEIIRKQAAAVLAPEHGIFMAGKDLLTTLDALKRISWNAYCILNQPITAQLLSA